MLTPEIAENDLTIETNNLDTSNDLPPASTDDQSQDQGTSTQDAIDWLKDKRAAEGGMWYDPEAKTPDPNRLYKAYKAAEAPLTQYQQALSKFDIKDPDSLSKVLEEYSGLVDPNNERNQILNRLNELYSHPELSKELAKTFENLRQKEIELKWGQNLPAHVVQQLQKVDHFEKYFEAQEKEKQIQQITDKVSEQLEALMPEAETIGVNLAEFLSDCERENIDPHYLKAYFRDKYFDKLKDRTAAQVSDNIQKKTIENKRGAIPSGTQKAPAPAPMTLEDRIRQTVRKHL